RVEGYKKRFTLVCSATELSGLRIVEVFCARFRQEDGFRDLKQRLGWEECRAWTRNPIERTTQAGLGKLAGPPPRPCWVCTKEGGGVEEGGGGGGGRPPAWNLGKTRPSVLDVERLLRQHREELQRGLAGWLDSEGNTGE